MRLEIIRKDFLKSWTIAEGFSDSKSYNPSARGILLSAYESNTVKLLASNLETSIICPANGVNVLEAGKALIPAALLSGMLKKTEQETVVLEVQDGRGVFISGRNKMRFSTLNSDEFPHIPSSNGSDLIFNIDAASLHDIIEEGSACAGKPLDFPKYRGACIIKSSEHNIEAASTDAANLVVSTLPINIPGRQAEVVLQAQALKKAAKFFGEGEITVKASASLVWFVNGDTEISVRRVEATFPNYRAVIKDNYKAKIIVEQAPFLSALDRLTLITTKTRPVILHLSKESGLKLFANAPDVGTATEYVPVEYDGEDFIIGFQVERLLNILTTLGSNKIDVRFTDEQSMALFRRVDEPERLIAIVMPMRLSEGEKQEAINAS